MTKPYGLVAAFDSTPALYHACERVRDAGYTQWDAITPFPVHGLDAAMGMRRSRVPRISLTGGVIGFATGMSLIWWTGAWDYPLIVGGKPYFSAMFAFPVSYELTILLSAFGSFFGMLILNRLPRFSHPVFGNPRFDRASSDRFFIAVDATDARYDRSKLELDRKSTRLNSSH